MALTDDIMTPLFQQKIENAKLCRKIRLQQIHRPRMLKNVPCAKLAIEHEWPSGLLLYFMGLEIQNSRFLKMGHFQVSGDSRHLLKILFYGTLEIENGFEQLYGGGRCLELHAQGTMSVRMLFR